MRLTSITPQIVESAPAQLKQGVLYISEKYRTALHLCCCGCGLEVVTPLSSAEWQLHRTGGAVSLHPSIGNWSFACQSHYWIRQNNVVWAGAMSKAEIARSRRRDQCDKDRRINEINARKLRGSDAKKSTPTNFWMWLKSLWQ